VRPTIEHFAIKDGLADHADGAEVFERPKHMNHVDDTRLYLGPARNAELLEVVTIPETMGRS
jgi:hypothetical protein